MEAICNNLFSMIQFGTTFIILYSRVYVRFHQCKKNYWRSPINPDPPADHMIILLHTEDTVNLDPISQVQKVVEFSWFREYNDITLIQSIFLPFESVQDFSVSLNRILPVSCELSLHILHGDLGMFWGLPSCPLEYRCAPTSAQLPIPGSEVPHGSLHIDENY